MIVDGRTIKAEMVKQNFTQIKLANEIGISARSINLKLNGKRDFSATELYNLSLVLKTDMNIFFKHSVN